MKSITVKNFAEVFPGFVQDLHDASYIAIDLEFTGIDRKTDTDYLTSPENACAEKLRAARLYSPIQLGISIFRGDALLDDTTVSSHSPNHVGTAMSHSTPLCASASYREVMIQEAKSFRAVEPATKSLGLIVYSIAQNGAVTAEDLQKLQEILREVQQVSATTSETCLYDRLFSFLAEDEVREAIGMVERWKDHIESGARHLCARNYCCYLFPAVRSNEVDQNVVLSAEAVAFLQKNNMDWNKWIGESLPLLPLEDYAAARTAVQRGTSNTRSISIMDEALESLRGWIDSLPYSDGQMKLSLQYSRVVNFVRTGAVGDTIPIDFPFLKSQDNAKLCDLLRALGLRKTGRCLAKSSPVSNAKKSSNEDLLACDQRFFGARVLEALVNATRRKRKPLIIHNGLSDLAFLCCAMHSEPPRIEREFKLVVREMFPLFYDTRTLCCVPSLQHIPNVTGPLMKVYTLFKSQNDTKVEVSLDAFFVNHAGELSMKEHDAAFDAFTTGSLFAFVQDELRKVGVDFRRLRCISPIYGSVFSVQFENESGDCIVQNPSSLIYAIKRQPHIPLYVDGLRANISSITKYISVIHNPEVCFITVGNGAFTDIGQKSIDMHIHSWCESNGFTFQRLDITSRMHEYGIVPIN
ncbi:Ribonuclease CAF1 [Trypanosoma melophagium]|uniref:Ribonuclease CAF1 n=1 Tax=Trypanosoma melophagium TaxID=715481 RepID=UPI00351A78D6|nr:Ribonuclease CAF1 [Trypanosoma melophagium]